MRRRVRRRTLLAGLAAGAAGAAGCTALPGGDTPTPPTENPAAGDVEARGGLTVESPAFDDGEPIPEKYGKDHENVNPPLEVGGVPDGAGSLALVVDDPDAPDGTFDHWLVWNVPPDVGSIPEGWDPPEGVVQGENDFGNARYDGPKPPSEHVYRFKLFALGGTPDLSADADKVDLGEAMAGDVLGAAQLEGTFAP